MSTLRSTMVHNASNRDIFWVARTRQAEFFNSNLCFRKCSESRLEAIP